MGTHFHLCVHHVVEEGNEVACEAPLAPSRLLSFAQTRELMETPKQLGFAPDEEEDINRIVFKFIIIGSDYSMLPTKVFQVLYQLERALYCYRFNCLSALLTIQVHRAMLLPESGNDHRSGIWHILDHNG